MITKDSATLRVILDYLESCEPMLVLRRDCECGHVAHLESDHCPACGEPHLDDLDSHCKALKRIIRRMERGE